MHLHCQWAAKSLELQLRSTTTKLVQFVHSAGASGGHVNVITLNIYGVRVVQVPPHHSSVTTIQTAGLDSAQFAVTPVQTARCKIN